MMDTARSQYLLNQFHKESLGCNSCYINPRIVFKLKALNATITPKKHTFRANIPGYYVEWFYNVHTMTYIYISGATNAIVFKDEGDLDSLCDTFGAMFGYDV